MVTRSNDLKMMIEAGSKLQSRGSGVSGTGVSWHRRLAGGREQFFVHSTGGTPVPPGISEFGVLKLLRDHDPAPAL